MYVMHSMHQNHGPRGFQTSDLRDRCKIRNAREGNIIVEEGFSAWLIRRRRRKLEKGSDDTGQQFFHRAEQLCVVDRL